MIEVGEGHARTPIGGEARPLRERAAPVVDQHGDDVEAVGNYEIGIRVPGEVAGDDLVGMIAGCHVDLRLERAIDVAAQDRDDVRDRAGHGEVGHAIAV